MQDNSPSMQFNGNRGCKTAEHTLRVRRATKIIIENQDQGDNVQSDIENYSLKRIRKKIKPSKSSIIGSDKINIKTNDDNSSKKNFTQSEILQYQETI